MLRLQSPEGFVLESRPVITPSASAIAAGLIQAYRETLFIAHMPEQLVLQIGVFSAGLERCYRKEALSSAAFLTACNPFSRPLSAEENAERQERLRANLTAGAFRFFTGEGRHPSGDWPPEASFLVLGVAESEARALGERYEQNAIVRCGSDAIPQLLLLR